VGNGESRDAPLFVSAAPNRNDRSVEVRTP
jgi:hypothetical protein